MSAADVMRHIEGLVRQAAAARPRPAPLARQVRDLLREDMGRRFEGSRGPDGRPWAALKYRRGKALIKSGRLLAAAVDMAGRAAVDVGEAGVIVSIDPGLLPDYGRFQNDGTKRIPAREFVGVSEAGLGKVQAAITAGWTAAALKALGG